MTPDFLQSVVGPQNLRGFLIRHPLVGEGDSEKDIIAAKIMFLPPRPELE
jgi:hypothetical protein